MVNLVLKTKVIKMVKTVDPLKISVYRTEEQGALLWTRNNASSPSNTKECSTLSAPR